jgi:hypothetical protein
MLCPHESASPGRPVEVQLLSPSSSSPCPNESALPRQPMRSQLLSFSSQALCPHKSALPRRPVESQPVSPPCRLRGLAWIRHAQTACEGQTCLIIGVCPHESALPRRPVESKLAPSLVVSAVSSKIASHLDSMWRSDLPDQVLRSSSASSA